VSPVDCGLNSGRDSLLSMAGQDNPPSATHPPNGNVQITDTDLPRSPILLAID
jgi:hypothetical protein